jgi:hypothetical protein
MRLPLVVLGSILAVALGGCIRQDGSPAASGTELTGYAIPVRREDATSRLASERCRREAACLRIGAGLRYEDGAQCLESLEHESDDELGRLECGVIAADGLDRCLDAIRRAPCEQIIEDLGTVPECSHNRLCR